MINAIFNVLSTSNGFFIFDDEEIFISFQGNKVLKSSIPIEDLYGVVLTCVSDDTMGVYYVVLCNNTIHNISELDVRIILKLINDRDLVKEFDSLKLAIEAVML